MERMQKKWTSPVYGFFCPDPLIEYVDTRRCHTFTCAAKSCTTGVRQFLDQKDASTSNMRRHAKKCWGDETVKLADSAKSPQEVRDKIAGAILQDGSVTAAFERKGKEKVTYSHRQHTKRETRQVILFLSILCADMCAIVWKSFVGCLRTADPSTLCRTPVFSVS